MNQFHENIFLDQNFIFVISKMAKNQLAFDNIIERFLCNILKKYQKKIKTHILTQNKMPGFPGQPKFPA